MIGLGYIKGRLFCVVFVDRYEAGPGLQPRPERLKTSTQTKRE